MFGLKQQGRKQVMQGTFTERIVRPKNAKMRQGQLDPKRDKRKSKDFSRQREQKRGWNESESN
jgi:hypothetical protein